jgi:hypothetical protein
VEFYHTKFTHIKVLFCENKQIAPKQSSDRFKYQEVVPVCLMSKQFTSMHLLNNVPLKAVKKNHSKYPNFFWHS